ncbi:hypothetical protein [Mycolicibacterium fluoranthenivorans]|jgi:hypothetical protein|uniref:Uncharacterized protein n=1 Tax=Mycolicibacterium fluoranthenivorans TaxID=258505 RepID=A0A1G4WRM6_9MYCO|nr:hypothetical protein [Mycolicibacterium fluoranthenivorans]SCX28103.1 hypothetical protein SAMN02799620_04525 [Mycolicibacterium fluoranthenivorans]
MSKTGRTNYRRGARNNSKAERHIVVRSIRRDPPDLRKLSRAVIAMALRDVEAQAEAREALTAPDSSSADTATTSKDTIDV